MALFEDDGCTLWPDTWFGVSITHCCDVHDDAFAYGTTLQEFAAANEALFWCVGEAGLWPLALVMLIGVCIVGAPFFFVGRKKRR